MHIQIKTPKNKTKYKDINLHSQVIVTDHNKSKIAILINNSVLYDYQRDSEAYLISTDNCNKLKVILKFLKYHLQVKKIQDQRATTLNLDMKLEKN